MKFSLNPPFLFLSFSPDLSLYEEKSDGEKNGDSGGQRRRWRLWTKTVLALADKNRDGDKNIDGQNQKQR